MKREITVPVVGLSHYMDNYDDFCEKLVKDSYVFVSHDRSNRFDECAIEVKMPDGRTVGYVSSKYSPQVYGGIGERNTMARIVGGKHKSFGIRMMVDAEGYDNAIISTESDEIKSQLPEGVIGLRNVLPILLPDSMMEQAWTMIEAGQETGDEALVHEGVTTFGKYFGCSLCVEDEMRAVWIMEHNLDKDGEILSRSKDLSDSKFVYESLLHQLEGFRNIETKRKNEFHKRFVDAFTGDDAVKHWLDTILDGQLKGCYIELTPDMASIILYHKLSRIDIYTILSHLEALKTKKDKMETEDKTGNIQADDAHKQELFKHLFRLTPYIKNIKGNEYEQRLRDMFDLSKQDNYTDGRVALWRLLTLHFSRDNKENGIDRVVTMNLVGKLKENDYFIDSDDLLAKISYDSGNWDSDGNNIGRAFEAKRYTKEINSLVNYYFP